MHQSQNLRRAAVLAVACAASLTGAACGHGRGAAQTEVLPLRTLRLYETGIGYFERRGEVATEHTSLPVPASHLDDALKSLVVFGGEGQAAIRGVEFSSSLSQGLARALAGLPPKADGAITHAHLLRSMKGALIEVTGADGRIEGRLVDVIDEPATPGGAAAGKAGGDADDDDEATTTAPGERLVLLIVGEGGAIRRLPVHRVKAVRPVEEAVAARLDSALSALSRQGLQQRRLLRVLATAAGPVTLGYVAEAPLWRTSYRLVIGEAAGQAVLQGWALLHNDTDESWRDVRVELVSGQPDSFLFPLAAPRYLRRELVHPEHPLATVPQLLGTTADAIWGDNLGGEDDEAYGAGGIGLSGSGSGGGGYGHGFGRAGSSGRLDSDILQVGNLARAARASGEEQGAIFVYALSRPLDLRAHGSALVPFLHEQVSALRVTRANSSGSSVRAAVVLTNGTRNTLTTGPIAVFDGGGRFAGETVLERMKQGETRYLPYGTDLDVELSVEREPIREETRAVVLRDDRLEEHYLAQRRVTCTMRNRSVQPRELHVELDLGANARIDGADRVAFDADASRPLAVFQLAPQKKDKRALTTVEGLVRRTGVDALSVKALEQLAAAPVEARAITTLKAAAARQRVLEQTVEQMAATRAEIGRVEQDIKRLQEHLKAAGGSRQNAAANVFVQRLVRAEDRLDALGQQLRAAEKARAAQQTAVRAALAPLAHDPTRPAADPAGAPPRAPAPRG